MKRLRNIASIIVGIMLPVLAVSQKLDSALFLSPYIRANQIDEARNLSRVVGLPSSVVSYSGLITVDDVNGAHTFFWFFPAANDAENAPVFLWSDGGPGVSCLFSLFTEHGPWALNSDGDLIDREAAWTKNYSMIYIDQPMDVGYSFIEQEAGYVTSGADVAPNVYSFLTQFFKMFPEYRNNDFYNSGASFGGIYAPAIAHYIHVKNQQTPEEKINLKGMLLETPFMDPISQVDYGEYLYHTGLIDDEARNHFRRQSEQIKSLINNERYLEAQELNLELLWGSQYGTYFTNVTGFSNNYNILKDKLDESFSWIFIAEPKLREYLHVGNLSFNFASTLVQTIFKPNVLRSVKPLIENLLDLDYKVLIYSGQLDIITSHMGVQAAIKNFAWNGSDDFKKSRNRIWRVNGTVAGYARNVKNFTHVLMRNAGHGAVQDQPIWTLDLLQKFTQGIQF